MATMAAITDQVVRLLAVDHPSLFSAHVAGKANHPKSQPFGFDAGPFVVQSEHMQFTDPHFVAVRTAVLDYFEAQRDGRMIPEDEQTLKVPWSTGKLNKDGVRQKNKDGTPIPLTTTQHHLLFNWEQHMGIGPAEYQLGKQLCWQIGFPEHCIPEYWSGQEEVVLSNFPEMRYYRDIVFMFKFMMSTSREAFPPVRSPSPPTPF